MNLKIIGSWDVTPYILVKFYRRFREIFYTPQRNEWDGTSCIQVEEMLLPSSG
jgi:hypothetical protein